MYDIYTLFYFIFILSSILVLRHILLFVLVLFGSTQKLEYGKLDLITLALSISYIITYIKFT